MMRLLVRMLALVVVLFVLVPSCVGFVARLPAMAGRAATDAASGAASGVVSDVTGFAKWAACNIAGVDELCTLQELSQAPSAALRTRLSCIETAVAENGLEGLAAKNACTAVANDPTQWEGCMHREFDKVPALGGQLISCSSYAPSQWGPFWAKLVEGVACPMGITSWCQTGGAAPTQAQAQQNYDTQCLATVFNRNLGAMPELSCNQFTSRVIDGQGERVVVNDVPKFQACLIQSITQGLKDTGAQYIRSCRVAPAPVQ